MCWLDSSGKRSSRCAETRIRLYARLHAAEACAAAYGLFPHFAAQLFVFLDSDQSSTVYLSSPPPLQTPVTLTLLPQVT